MKLIVNTPIEIYIEGQGTLVIEDGGVRFKKRKAKIQPPFIPWAAFEALNTIKGMVPSQKIEVVKNTISKSSQVKKSVKKARPKH